MICLKKERGSLAQMRRFGMLWAGCEYSGSFEVVGDKLHGLF